MPIEIGSIEQIRQERDRLSRCLAQRESLVDLIGTGAVKVGESFENTLKVGRVKGLVKASIIRIQGERDNLNQDLDAYNQARDYLGQVSLRQTQLSQIGQMVDEGNLTSDIYELHKTQLEELTSSSQINPILIRGLQLVRLEEEAKKTVKTVVLTPSKNEVSPVISPNYETSEQLKETKESERYKLPNGQEVGGKVAQLLHLLDGTSADNLLTSDQITQAIWPDVDNESARNRLNMSVSRLRANSEKTGLDIIVILDHSERRKGRKASYYLKLSDKPIDFYLKNKEPISNETVCRQSPEISSIDEEIASINKPEYGTLSRADIDAIASAIICYEESLKSILETSKVRLIDQSILIELQELTGDTPLADFSKMTKEEHCQFANQFRIQALQKAKTLLESPEADQILDNIYTQNNNVWCLLVNLSEMDKVEVTVWNEGTTKQGITFLTDLVANPEARKQGFSVKTKPNITTPKLPLSDQTDTNRGEITIEPPATLTETPKVTPVLVTPIIPEVTQTKTILKTIEVYDPFIRTRINGYLDQILEHPELLSAASSATVTRAFPSLKRKTMDQAMEANCIPVEQSHDGKNRFGPIGVASLLYLHEFGQKLPGRLKKQIKDIVAEEQRKR